MSAPESVAIVAMGASAGTYLRLCTVRGNRRRVADETWAINAAGGVIQHDLLFQMDDLAIQEERAKADPIGTVAGTLEWLKGHGNFYTSRAYPSYPGGKEYPLADVVNALNVTYFNNTVAYAIAYAIYLNVKCIKLFGADFSYKDIHKAERGRGCVEFLLGIAAERKIRIELADDTSIMDANVPKSEKLYGYDTEDVTIDRNPDGPGVVVTRKQREKIPTPEEINQRYKHVATE